MFAPEDQDPDAETRTLAYVLWEQAGRPDGQEVMFWDLAEAQHWEHASATTPGPDEPPTA